MAWSCDNIPFAVFLNPVPWEEGQPEGQDRQTGSDLDVVLHLQTVGLVLVLFDLSGDLRYFPALAEVDERLLAVAFEEIRVPLFRLQDVG